MILGALYLATAIVLGGSWGLAAQFLLGYEDPFKPKQHLRSGQQGLATLLRFAGWIAVPATVGASAGLLVNFQKEEIFNQDPRTLPKRLWIDRFSSWLTKWVVWMPLKWVVWMPLKWIIWPFIWPLVFPLVRASQSILRSVHKVPTGGAQAQDSDQAT
ncbi:hypothetical protein [Streptomyces sp. N2A]|uniref:hypothetical protein n=1 Tax=Streptomyces sp. N2A TaxID=3073936 RepID=UPI00286FC14E|nr:hypothetical protein [Streptomyces sp. N2A]